MTTDRPSDEPDSRYTTIHGGVQIPDTGPARPIAATPEEVLAKWQREHILDKGGIPTRHELLDLIRRAQAAQREADAPRVLTAYDPEPAVDSVVLDRHGAAWQRVLDEEGAEFWMSSGRERVYRWGTFFTLGYGPVTLIHDGEA